MHIVEPLVPESGSFEFEIAIEKLKRFKTPGVDQIVAELIQVDGNNIMFWAH